MSAVDGTLNSNVKPPAKHYNIGKSMPMNMVLPVCSSVGVSETSAGLKFVHISSERLRGKYLLILFMDNKLTNLEINEWLDFSKNKQKFRDEGCVVLGVATASHVALRTWMMNRMKGITFPVLADISGEIARTFGVFNKKTNVSSRAVAIVSPDNKLLHLTVNNETTISTPNQMLSLFRRISTAPTLSSSVTTEASPATKATRAPTPFPTQAPAEPVAPAPAAAAPAESSAPTTEQPPAAAPGASTPTPAPTAALPSVPAVPTSTPASNDAPLSSAAPASSATKGSSSAPGSSADPATTATSSTPAMVSITEQAVTSSANPSGKVPTSKEATSVPEAIKDASAEPEKPAGVPKTELSEDLISLCSATTAGTDLDMSKVPPANVENANPPAPAAPVSHAAPSPGAATPVKEPVKKKAISEDMLSLCSATTTGTDLGISLNPPPPTEKLSKAPSPAPESKASPPAPVSKAPSPAPESKAPPPAPVSKAPSPAPVSKAPSPAPKSNPSATAPVSNSLAPAPVSTTPAPASVSTTPAPAPVTSSPVSVTNPSAPVSKPPAPAPVSKPPAPAPVSKPPAPAPVSKPSAPAPVSKPSAPAPVSDPPALAPASSSGLDDANEEARKKERELARSDRADMISMCSATTNM